MSTGTAINDPSSVVTASTTYGHAVASYGVIVKLTRTFVIIPMSLALVARRNRRATPELEGPGKRRIVLGRVLPVFIVVLVVVAANTVGLVPRGWHHPLSDLSTWMITAARGAIGLPTDFAQIHRAGSRPLALGTIL